MSTWLSAKLSPDVQSAVTLDRANNKPAFSHRIKCELCWHGVDCKKMPHYTECNDFAIGISSEAGAVK